MMTFDPRKISKWIMASLFVLAAGDWVAMFIFILLIEWRDQMWAHEKAEGDKFLGMVSDDQ